MENNLIVIPQELPKGRAKILYEEFKYAWDRTSKEEKKKWAIECLKLFAKVTLRRIKGFVLAVAKLGKGLVSETVELGKSIYNNRAGDHLVDRKNKVFDFISNGIKTSKTVLSNTIYLLKNKPSEAGPIMLLGILGFFVGSGGLDGDGGIPDLDIAVGGIGNHRSIFFHSIISAAVLESMVFSSVKAVNIIHSKLPENHDPFWDKVSGYQKWAEAFVSGACVGIAYHLLIDGTIQGNKAYVDLPIKGLSMDAHNTIFVSNAVAEALDLDKKKVSV